jgi:hypothetical protein
MVVLKKTAVAVLAFGLLVHALLRIDPSLVATILFRSGNTLEIRTLNSPYN